MKDYRLPAEWEKHEATWLVWPHNTETWYNGSLEAAQEEYVFFLQLILRKEKVHLIVPASELENPLIVELAKDEGLTIHEFQTNDSWVRDFGPDFLLKDNKLLALEWSFNSWGEKYPYVLDDKASSFIIETLNCDHLRSSLVLEGGSFEVNEEGVCLTTESCLLNANRNPNYSKSEIEHILLQVFGFKRIVWLKEGVEGDDTDGHIDDFCRFIPSGQVLLAKGRPQSRDEEIMEENKVLLLKEGFDVIDLPMPDEPVVFDGVILPASYANYYVCNFGVLVPVFDDEQDGRAIQVISSCFPNRRVIGVPARKLLIGLGGLHCLSKQQPSVDKL